jgi:uncharacterized protein YjeT (DUF2065 family)
MRCILKPLRILGILVIVAGVVMIGTSQYIKGEVLKGREQISSGEKSVSQGRKLFGVNPVSKEVGDTVLFNQADRKIAAGKMQANDYARLANHLQTGGIIAILVGAGILVISFKKKR